MEWVEKILHFIKSCYYEGDFNSLIKFLNIKIPLFLEKYENILYMIMKYILFDKIRVGDNEKTQKFYTFYFLPFLRKNYKENWENKNSTFLKIISNGKLLKLHEYDIKAQLDFQNFILVCEREIFSFIQIKKGLDNNEILKHKIFCTNNTVELEEEILKIMQEKNYNHLDPKKDLSSNYNNFRKNYIPKIRKNHTLKDLVPLLKNFNPSYTKRTNIDKRILRKFKNFINSKSNIEIKHNLSFWSEFSKGKLSPPFNYYDEELAVTVEFKSFNSEYLKWLFNKKSVSEFFEVFLKEKGKECIDQIIKDYQLTDSIQIEKLQNYIFNLSSVFVLTEDQHSVQKKGNESTTENSRTFSTTSTINTEVPSNPLTYEKVYENYLGQNFDMSKKEDIFEGINNIRGNMKARKRKSYLSRSDSESEKSFERSRELDYNLFDYFKKCWFDENTEKEE
jgi:hypothetical protein